MKNLLGFIIAITCLYLLYIPQVELCSDEAYYWTWAKHLAWGYYDHPPMVAWFIWLGTFLIGNTELGVRLLAVISAILLLLMVYIIAQRIFHDEPIGLIASLLLGTTLGFTANSVIMTPDVPLLLFWAISVYLVYNAFFLPKNNLYYWLLTGLVVGLGNLSKYTMVLFIPAIFFFITTSSKVRYWLLRKDPYLAAIIAIGVTSPVIGWNATHHWVSLKMQFKHGFFQKINGGIPNMLSFLGGEAGLIFPIFFILFLVGTGWVGYKGFRNKKSELLFLFWLSAFPFLFFFLLSLFSKCEGNWPAPAYITGFINLAWFIHQGIQKRIKWLIITITLMGGLISLVFTSLVIIHSLHPILPIPAEKDITNRLHGFKKASKEIEGFISKMPQTPFILAENHHLSSKLSFYSQEKNYEIYTLYARVRYPYWKNLEKLIGRNAAFITDNERINEISYAFQQVKGPTPLNIYYHNHLIHKLYLWQCFYYKGGLF
ncbi:MAG: glycosyltransferase family 39 protein [bacterium]